MDIILSQDFGTILFLVTKGPFPRSVAGLECLTLKALNKIAADDILMFLLLSFEENKAWFFRIHLKHQVLFSLKNN